MKFLFCADLHLRPDRPRCRKDEDWVETQKQQLIMIASTARHYNAPVVIGGDIFHTPQVPDYIKTMFLRAFDGVSIHILAGQHDLPYHSWGRIDASSFGVIWQMRGSLGINSILAIGSYAHYNQKIEENISSDILFLHRLVFPRESKIPPNVKAITAKGLLIKYPKYKWILCGDNHHSFHYENEGRHVIMAGSMNRQAIDMKDHEPRVWIIDTDTEDVEVVYIPDDIDMLIADEYIKEVEERNERLNTFIETIKGAKKVSLDFIENVNSAMSANDFTKKEKEIILSLVGGINES